MGIEPVDRRVRKTRRQLRECLITLLKEKKVQDITVRELTDMADLNRGTFYLHYKDVFDLLEKTEAELQEDFNQLVCKHDAVDLKQRPSVIFNEIYSLVYDNADLIEILLGENGDLNFVNRLKQLIREKCLKDWMELFRPGAGGGRQTSRSSQNTLLDDSAFEAYYSFTVTGCIGLVQYWLQTGLKETPEQMAKLTEHIITKGIGVLEIDPYV